MKKLILTVAILAGGVSTFALPTNTSTTDPISVVMSDEFKQVALDKLPASVVEAVKRDFAEASITSAYVNSAEQYKLNLTIDGKTGTVYADKEGNWIQEDDVKGAE